MAGTPIMAASRAPATVPEYMTSSPQLRPRLMPDTTSTGRVAANSGKMAAHACSASAVQSAGVPDTCVESTHHRTVSQRCWDDVSYADASMRRLQAWMV